MEDKRTPDKFRFSNVMAVIAAVFVIAVCASAAGNAVFDGYGSDGDDGRDAPTDTVAEDTDDEGLVALLGHEDDAGATLSGGEDGGTTSDDLPHAAARSLFDGASDAVAAAATDAAQRQGTAMLARLTTDAGDDDAAPAVDPEALAKANEAKEKTFSVFRAVADLWNALFARTWPFLKGIGGATWSVLQEGSHYTAPAE